MNCSICKNNSIASRDEIAATKCGHCFHKDCIARWLSENSYCPSCRKPVGVFSPLLQLFIEFGDESSLAEEISELNEEISIRDANILELSEEVNQLKLDLDAERELRRTYQNRLPTTNESRFERSADPRRASFRGNNNPANSIGNSFRRLSISSPQQSSTQSFSYLKGDGTIGAFH